MIHVRIVLDGTGKTVLTAHAYNVKSDDSGPWYVQTHTVDTGHVLVGRHDDQGLPGSARTAACAAVDGIAAQVATLIGGRVVDRVS